MSASPAPALSQALEELHQRLILDHGRGLVMQMFANDVELLRAAAARLRSAETRPTLDQFAARLRALVKDNYTKIDELGDPERRAYLRGRADGYECAAQIAETSAAAAPALPGETPARCDEHGCRLPAWEKGHVDGCPNDADDLPLIGQGETPAEPPQERAAWIAEQTEAHRQRTGFCRRCENALNYCECGPIAAEAAPLPPQG